jgi:class 3 adenylate cyclase
VVNLAARLCGEAKDGQILIDESVKAAVASFVKWESVGDLALKGIRHPGARLQCHRPRRIAAFP